MKIKSKGKSLIKRILASYFVAVTVDILCFMILAFSGTMPTLLLIKLISAAFLKKIIFQIILLPATYYLITLLKHKEKFEIFDYDTKFNPFSFDNVYEINCFKIKSNSNENIISDDTAVNLLH